MKLHIEHAGNGQTIIASETGPVAYMAPDLPEGVEEMLAAAFAAAPAFLAENARLSNALDEVWAVASGERQVAMDDTAGMEWITYYVSSVSGKQKV